MGGTDHSGIDCSGFVQRIYRDLFGLQLPRTTTDQVQYTNKIQSQTLQPGDLVFFRPSQTVRHVGIYLGEGEFAHASKSKGVMVSRMDDPYWREVYWTARRVLSESP
jgi:cell wall-associated NlpC family hydrolase